MEEVGNYRMKESMASWWVNMGDTAVELGDMNMLELYVDLLEVGFRYRLLDLTKHLLFIFSLWFQILGALDNLNSEN